MAGILERLKLIGKAAEEDYAEVDLGQFDDSGRSPDMILRVAELGREDALPEIKQVIYAGISYWWT